MQSAQSGSVRVPETIAVVAAAGRARGGSALAGRTPGLAGGAGDAARCRRAADRAGQDAAARGSSGTAGPSGVRRSTGRRRPQFRQVSRFAGSVMKQLAQTGRPCSSRVTGSRRAPQRAHSWSAGVCDAGAADPHPVERLVDAHDPAAARTGRADDSGDTAVVRAARSAAGSRAAVRGARPRSAARVGLRSAQASFCW